MLPVDTIGTARPAVQAGRLCDLQPQDMAVWELSSNQRKAKLQSNRWKSRHTWKKGRERNPGERIRLAKEWEEEAELESESPAVGSQNLRQLKYVPSMCLWCGGLLILCESIYAMMVVFAPIVLPADPTDQPPTQSSSLSDSSPPHGLAHFVPIASESSLASPPPPWSPLLRPYTPLSPPAPISPPSTPLPLPAGTPRCQKPPPPPRPTSPPPPHPSPPSNPASFLQTVAAPAPASSGLPPSHPPPPHVPMSYFCPKGYHLCNPNKKQPLHFCDVDVDCWGDVDYCHPFNSVCREQRGCCVVPAVRSFLPPSPPPLPPAPPAPLVPVCPEHTHLCAPNGRQKGIFCDVDRDCYGDMNYCRASPACPAKKGCCIQQPKACSLCPGREGPRRLIAATPFNPSRHRRMWGVHSRHQNHKGDPACWSRARDADWVSQLPEQYFEDIFSGRYCQLTDWYDGSPFAHGIFSRAAPALLGFDADILGFCNGNCDGANANILALFGNHVKYNTCRNLEWQMCAVRGMLDWQDSKEIMFARAPKTVSMDGVPPFGHCSGYTDAPCNDWEGFANDDIFYLEVCLFSMLCKNSDELFKLNVGERFICDFSEEGFSLLQQLLLEGPDS